MPAYLTRLSMVLILPLVVLCSGIAYAWSVADQARLTREAVSQSSEMTADVGRYLQDQITVLQALAASTALDDGQFDRFERQLDALFDRRTHAIVLREVTGQVRVDTRWNGEGRPTLAGDQAALSTGSPYVSDLLDDASGRGLAVVITVPVKRGEAVPFTLSSVLLPDAFVTLLQQGDGGPEQLASIADRQGRLIARTAGGSLEIGQPIAGFAARTGNRGLWTGVNSRAWHVRMYYNRLPGSGWLVSYGMSRQAYWAPLERSALWLAGLIGAGAVAAFSLAIPLLSRERVAQRKLRDASDLLMLAHEAAGTGAFEWEPGSERVRLSPASARMHGLEVASSQSEPVEISLDDWNRCVLPADLPRVRAQVQSMTVAAPMRRIEFRTVDAATGALRWVQSLCRVAFDPATGAPVRYVGLHLDVTERREAEAQIEHMALYDELTSLPNRRLLVRRLDQAVIEVQGGTADWALLALDLDGLKAVNDTYGHVHGDRLLQAVALRLQGAARPEETAARLGGDEFCLVLSQLAEPAAVKARAEDLRAMLAVPIGIDDVRIEVGIGIGALIIPRGGMAASELLQRVDIALFEAKASGRNSYRLFDPDLAAARSARNLVALEMPEAIRRGDFILLYQPVVDVATEQVVSCEALMRWRHPERGLISPADFVPVAEETGLIVPLGAWALGEACREAMFWPDRVRVAVNVSTVQMHGQLESTVIDALSRAGLAPDRLKLEVTESALMADPEAGIALLRRIQALGVRIALDDFGTGYSSLSYLRRFPFDKLKIDRSFIRDIADPDAAAIVRAVVALGERLGMGIVAEGVETAEQLALVRAEGCGEVQGFFFSRPLTAVQARRYLLTHRAQPEARLTDLRGPTRSGL